MPVASGLDRDRVVLSPLRPAGRPARLRLAGEIELHYLEASKEPAPLGFSLPRNLHFKGQDILLPQPPEPAPEPAPEPIKEVIDTLRPDQVAVDEQGRVSLDLPLGRVVGKDPYVLARVLLTVERVGSVAGETQRESLTLHYFEGEDPGPGKVAPSPECLTQVCAVWVEPGCRSGAGLRGRYLSTGTAISGLRDSLRAALGEKLEQFQPSLVSSRVIPARDGGWILNPVSKDLDVREAEKNLGFVIGREIGLRNDLRYAVEGTRGADGLCKLVVGRNSDMPGYVPARWEPAQGPGCWAPPFKGNVWDDGLFRDHSSFCAIYRQGKVIGFYPNYLIDAEPLWIIYYAQEEPWAAWSMELGRQWHRTASEEWPERMPSRTAEELAVYRCYAEIARSLWTRFGAALSVE